MAMILAALVLSISVKSLYFFLMSLHPKMFQDGTLQIILRFNGILHDIICTSPTEFPMTKETMYLITDIFFDMTKGGEGEYDAEEASDLSQDAIGLWYARGDNLLCDKVSQAFGFPIISINATTNTLHPLTSYL